MDTNPVVCYRGYRRSGFVVCLFLLSLGLVLALNHSRATTAFVVTYLTVLVIAFSLVYRITIHPCLLIDMDGFRVVNPLRTHGLKWEEVLKVQPAYWGLSIAGRSGVNRTAFGFPAKWNIDRWTNTVTAPDLIAEWINGLIPLDPDARRIELAEVEWKPADETTNE